MGCMVGFQDQGTTAHLPDPGFRQGCSLQEPTSPFNAGETGGYPVRDTKFGLKSLLQVPLLLIIAPGTDHAAVISPVI